MASERKNEVLLLSVQGGPPELDFLFSLSRGKTIDLTLITDDGKQDVPVYIDGIVIKEPAAWEDRPKWIINGRFRGDGIASWCTFPGKNGTDIFLGGEFTGYYDKRTRMGFIETTGYTYTPLANR